MNRLAALILTLWLAATAFAADAPPTVESSLTRGLKFLMTQHNHDGSFGAENARLLATSRALLVFLQRGNVPDSGRYGTAAKDAEEWMLKSILPSGSFSASDGRTRTQAAAVLALAETYGVESNPDRRTRVLAALRLAVQPLFALQTLAQNPPSTEAGGWADEKNAAPTLAITATVAAALSAARDCGVAVPNSTMESAKRYIVSCRDAATGGFAPQPAKPATIDATAAALVALDMLSPNGDDSDVTASATTYFEKEAAKAGNAISFGAAVWICWCDARLELPATAKLREAIMQHLIGTQQPDGGWNSPQSKPDAATPPRLSVTELALLGMTAHYRSTPVLRH